MVNKYNINHWDKSKTVEQQIRGDFTISRCLWSWRRESLQALSLPSPCSPTLQSLSSLAWWRHSNHQHVLWAKPQVKTQVAPSSSASPLLPGLIYATYITLFLSRCIIIISIITTTMFVIFVKFSLFLSALSLTTIYMKGRLTPYGLTFRWTYLHIQVITISKTMLKWKCHGDELWCDADLLQFHHHHHLNLRNGCIAMLMISSNFILFLTLVHFFHVTTGRKWFNHLFKCQRSRWFWISGTRPMSSPASRKCRNLSWSYTLTFPIRRRCKKQLKITDFVSRMEWNTLWPLDACSSSSSTWSVPFSFTQLTFRFVPW